MKSTNAKLSNISILRNEYVDGCKYYLDDNSISKVLKEAEKYIKDATNSAYIVFKLAEKECFLLY